MKTHKISLFSKNNNRIYSFLEIKAETIKQKYHVNTSRKQVVHPQFPIHQSLLCDRVVSAYFPTSCGDPRALFVCMMEWTIQVST